ncbi:tetratricopeptide repeat protein, partial [Acinetobacter colistiniresistens]
MRQLYRRTLFSGKTIRRYSTTILLLGSMSSYVSAQAIHDMYAEKSFEHALQQSMVAEFSLAYDDIATALHNYTVLAIRSNSTTIKQRALDIALEYNDLQSALNIATHWVEQEPKDVPALFYLSHIALKTHEYELAAKTLDKILNIDPTADLEEILVGIAPEQAQDREILLNALRASEERNNPSILALIAGLEAQDGLYEQALNNINQALRKRSKSTSFILMKANLLMALRN